MDHVKRAFIISGRQCRLQFIRQIRPFLDDFPYQSEIQTLVVGHQPESRIDIQPRDIPEWGKRISWRLDPDTIFRIFLGAGGTLGPDPFHQGREQ